MLRSYLSSGLAKRSSNLLEMLRLEAYIPALPLHEDRLHVANGTLFLDGKFNEDKDFCRNRLPVKYNPDAPEPRAWLQFLSELLEPEDILTLQEYLGYCLIPTTRGQTMMLLKGNGQKPNRGGHAGDSGRQPQKRQHRQGGAQSLRPSGFGSSAGHGGR